MLICNTWLISKVDVFKNFLSLIKACLLCNVFFRRFSGQFLEFPNPSVMVVAEFDKFLADRAAAGGERTGSVKSSTNRPRQRQMQMANQADEEMFGL